VRYQRRAQLIPSDYLTRERYSHSRRQHFLPWSPRTRRRNIVLIKHRRVTKNHRHRAQTDGCEEAR